MKLEVKINRGLKTHVRAIFSQSGASREREFLVSWERVWEQSRSREQSLKEVLAMARSWWVLIEFHLVEELPHFCKIPLFSVFK